MNAVQRMRRIEAIEQAAIGDGKNAWILREFPDGHFEGPDPWEVHPKDLILHIVATEAKGGQPLSEDELEAMYPGRRLRLKASHTAWAGKVRILASEEDLLL